MSHVEDVKCSLNVVMNKQKTKVLFAEAGSDFTDVLISFLALPLGTIIRVLKKHYRDEAPTVGSLTALYNGVANLDTVHFHAKCFKDTLLNPPCSFEEQCRKLKFNINEYFTCKNPICGATCVCGKTKKRPIGTAFILINTASFIITDDLKAFPNTKGLFQTLSNLGIDHTDVGEQTDVTFGFNEVMDLLKGSLLSSTPLTDFVLKRREVMYSAIAKTEQGILLHKKEATCNTKKLKLILMVQKSTNRLLFAQADNEFVDILFCLLTLPLGEVVHLLDSNTCLKSIDNLYTSTTDPFLVSEGTRRRIIELKGYYNRTISSFVVERLFEFVKGRVMYKIADDLTVTPFSTTSTISMLRELEIPLYDIEELELEIRIEDVI